MPRVKAKKLPGSSKGRGKELNKNLVLEKLKKYFQINLPIKRACDAFNTEEMERYDREVSGEKKKNVRPPERIAFRTVQQWYDDDEEVRYKIDSWRDTINVLARQGWRAKIQQGDYQACKEWLEKQERSEFGKDSPEVPPLQVNVVVALPQPVINNQIAVINNQIENEPTNNKPRLLEPESV